MTSKFEKNDRVIIMEGPYAGKLGLIAGLLPHKHPITQKIISFDYGVTIRDRRQGKYVSITVNAEEALLSKASFFAK